jgi:DNA-binding Lrp family transcriptional regulator
MSGSEEEDPRRDYPDDDFVAAVERHAPASTSEVADSVGCTRRNADYRLRRLAEQGRVDRKKIAATQVWSPAKD